MPCVELAIPIYDDYYDYYYYDYGYGYDYDYMDVSGDVMSMFDVRSMQHRLFMSLVRPLHAHMLSFPLSPSRSTASQRGRFS